MRLTQLSTSWGPSPLACWDHRSIPDTLSLVLSPSEEPGRRGKAE